MFTPAFARPALTSTPSAFARRSVRGGRSEIIVSTLVVFDARVADLPLLYKALLPGAIGFTIEESEDAIAKITQLIAETNAKQLAIVAHGEPGKIYLGDRVIDQTELEARSGLLEEWGVDAIELYACEVGADAAFVAELGELTGARIAASAMPVGNPALEGNWDLAGYAGCTQWRGTFALTGLGDYPGLLAAPINNLPPFTQIGSDINGEAAGDSSGWSVSLSADGSVVAIGATSNDGNGPASGHVRLYRNVNGTWTQIGSDINGEAADDVSGISVSLSADGSVVAIGAMFNDGSNRDSGHVRLYRNVGGTWTQIGSDIDGEALGDYSGSTVSLSADGSVVAIGASENNGTGVLSGHVRLYRNVSGTWTQIGSDIDGEAAFENSGKSVSLSADGSVVAIGAMFNASNGGSSGCVRLYRNVNGIWTQIGSDINGETAANNRATSYVSLSADGSVVAIGAYPSYDNSGDSGHVRLYRNVNGTWTQIGGDINGEAAGDHFGHSVSLSADGSVVAIGATSNDGNGPDSGHVRLYRNVNGTWTQIGGDIDGEADSDYSGGSVSLSADGSVVAIGASQNNGNGFGSGHVRLYRVAATGTEDTPVALTGISVNDVDGDLATTQLTVTQGKLTVNLSGGASITAGGNNSASLTLSGSQVQINAALTTLQYQGNLNYNGTDNLTILSTDSSGATDTDTLAITITAVNDAPALTGTPATLPLGNDNTNYTITASQLLQGYTDVDSNLISVGNLTATNGSLANNNNGTYTFTPNTNFTGSITLNYSVVDGNGGTTAGTKSFTIGDISETGGLVKLALVNGNYAANDVTTNAITPITYNGVQVTPTSYAGWSVVGAERVGDTPSGEIEYMWKSSNNVFWYSTNSNTGGVVSGDALLAKEVDFEQDFDGDGIIGVPRNQTLESFGAVSLKLDASGNYAAVDTATNVVTPITYNGNLVSPRSFGGWAVVGAERVGDTPSGEIEYMWKSSSDTFWYSTNSNTGGGLSGAALFAKEVDFTQDFNGDGVVGFASNQTRVYHFLQKILEALKLVGVEYGKINVLQNTDLSLKEVTGSRQTTESFGTTTLEFACQQDFDNDGFITQIGGSGDDAMVGSNAQDRLLGNGGNNILTGGGGDDLFTYNTLTGQNDIVTDFTQGQDKLDLRSLSSLGALSLSVSQVVGTADALVQINQGAATATITLQNTIITTSQGFIDNNVLR